jgi:enamine deaminase RidA (YjgF/YER057c/UK114 family)
MNKRINISSGAKWEDIIGYCRAVRIGNVIEVAGTCAVDDEGTVVGRNDPYTQTQYILAKIERALVSAGASLNDVVRTRVYLTDMTHWQEAGRAHGEVFGNIKPASTMLGVNALIGPELLVEVEATAIVTG